MQERVWVITCVVHTRVYIDSHAPPTQRHTHTHSEYTHTHPPAHPHTHTQTPESTEILHEKVEVVALLLRQDIVEQPLLVPLLFLAEGLLLLGDAEEIVCVDINLLRV
jgi:hypothetical protein